jgi:hypothetical protein
MVVESELNSALILWDSGPNAEVLRRIGKERKTLK